MLVPLCSWSSGVIMYTLLAGSPPFWHRKQMLMLRMILSGSYDYSSPEWDDRSDTVKDLVSDRVGLAFRSPLPVLQVFKFNTNKTPHTGCHQSCFWKTSALLGTKGTLVFKCLKSLAQVLAGCPLLSCPKIKVTFHFGTDLSVAGGEPRETIHSDRSLGPSLFPAVHRTGSAALQSLQEVQGNTV